MSATMDEPEDLANPEYRARHKHEFGRRLLTTLIDDRARRNHPRSYVSIPKTTNPIDGYRDITYRHFARAIDRCAWWIRSELSTSDRFEPLIYLGAFDLRYQILAMAAVKTGHVMFFISPRNSMEAQTSLIDNGQVTKMIVSAEPYIDAMVQPILQERPLQRFVIPELEYFLEDVHVKPIPFNGTFDEYRMKPWILLHTSGSTGNPKIVTIKHGYATTNDAYWHSPNGNELFDRIGNQRLFIPFPPFHMAGMIGCTSMSIYVDATVVLPPVAPLTPELVNNIHLYARVEFSMLPPAVIVELAKTDTYLENLKRLRGVNYAGGPLPHETGEKVNKHIGVFTNFGSTEMLAPPMLKKPREHWSYFTFDMEYSGLQFRQVDDTNLYEYVLVKDPALSLVQAIFVTFPELEEYHTKDLFSPHPTEPGLWKYEGRLDDVIVLNNAEKINPIDMEGTITSSQDVTGALVVGQARFQTALLLEVKTPPVTDEEKAKLLDSVWPYIQIANERCPTYGRIARGLVTFIDPAKPFARAGKGTIQRQRSVAMYAKEIDELYASYEVARKPLVSAPPNFEDPQVTQKFLHDWILNETRLGDITPGEDLFTAGLDSLEVANLVRQINACSPEHQIWAKQVYDNPNITLLALSLAKPPSSLREDEDDIDSWIQMQQTFNDTKVRPADNIIRVRDTIREVLTLEKVAELPRHFGSSKNKKQEYTARKDEKFLINMVQPDGGRTAWLQVLASFLINSNWGLVNSFGAFQAYYQAEYLSDYSPTKIAWIGTVEVALLLIVGMYSGLLFDRGHFRITLTFATVVLFFAMMMLSISTEYYQIMLTQGVLVGLCCGLLFVPSIALIPLYFRDRKGLALGIATAGGSFWGVIYPIIFRNLLNSVGFGWTVRVIAFILLASLGVAALLVQPLDDWKRPSRKLYEFSALKELPFACFTLAAFFSFCALLVPFFFTATFATSKLQMSPDTAFYMIAVINAAQFFGRIIPGAIADTSIGGEHQVLASYIICGILGFAWIAVHNVGGFVVFLLIYGFASGMATALPAIVMPYVCQSLAVLGTRLGMVYGLAGIGALISVPVAAAAASASSDGLLGAQLWTGLCMAVAACFFPVTAVAAVKRRKAIDSVQKTKARDIMRDLLRDAEQYGSAKERAFVQSPRSRIHSPTTRKSSHPEIGEKDTDSTNSQTGWRHVVLTGSTGSLGAYLLHMLLSDPTVAKITCLNRSADAEKRQASNHAKRGLATTFSSRVNFWACNLSAPDLGLQASQYQTLLQSATHFVHNAWPVDFNKHFNTFEPHVQGVRNLIEFTQACAPRPIRLFFMSSVSVAGRWGAMPGALASVPEIVLEDWRMAKMGYGQSKLVAERLVAEAATNAGIDAAICRVAQVGGPVWRGEQGEWNRAEWLPSLVLSSKTMGKIPETLGPMEMVDWLPVDIVAKTCVELLFSDTRRLTSIAAKPKVNKVQVWHVVNPRTTAWSALLPTITRGMEGTIRTIGFVQWIEELERLSDERQKEKGGDLSDLPAAKLLSFFDDLRDKAVRFPRTSSATLETKETVKHSWTMAKVDAVSPEWVDLWLKQWGIHVN